MVAVTGLPPFTVFIPERDRLTPRPIPPIYIEALKEIWKTPCFQDFNFDRYVVIDCETSGVNVKDDFVTQLGWLEIQGGHVTDHGGMILKMPPGVDALHPKVTEITGLTAELCNKSGVDRVAGIAAFSDYVGSRLVQGFDVVGHNSTAFDAPILHHESVRHQLDQELWLKVRKNLVDTGMLVKACQLGVHMQLPQPFGSREDYFADVHAIRSRVKWNLALSCELFGIMHDGNFFGECKPPPSLSQHDAEYDCFMCHCLLQRIRRLSKVELRS